MTGHKLAMWCNAEVTELVGHSRLDCVEVPAIAMIQLVTYGTPVTALTILQTHRHVGVEVETSEIDTAAMVNLRLTDIEDCREGTDCDRR